MPDPIKPKPDDRALPKAQALAGSQITATDIARSRAKWRRRVPDFEERIREAAGQGGVG